MMRLAVLLALVACGSKDAPALSAEDRESAMGAAKQCTDTVASLAPSYQLVGPKLSAALKMDRDEAKRLMRDSIELLISTREMLCGISAATVEGVLAKAPSDVQTIAANARIKVSLAKLQAVRKAYDELLGATSAASAGSAAPVQIDEAALLERFSRALTGN